MAILSASENTALMSFLSTMEYNSGASDSFLSPEWDLYAANTDLILPASGKETLAQATKDLMSLDSLLKPHTTTAHIFRPDTLHHSSSAALKQPMQYPLTLRTTVDPAAFAYSRSPPLADDVPSYASSSASSTDSAPSPSTPTEQLATPTFAPASPRLNNTKRPAPSSSSSSGPSTKRARSSTTPTASATTATPSSSSSSSTATASGSGSKPALLSATQKKANHIQSEQKRRANIRRGYEALCDAVPSLREEGSDGASSTAAASTTKSKKKRSVCTDAANPSDGRAGPRSENVVLQKSIDYIQDLIAEQESLKARLAAARVRASNHPHLHLRLPNGEVLPWERKWTGGKPPAKAEDEDEDD